VFVKRADPCAEILTAHHDKVNGSSAKGAGLDVVGVGNSASLEGTCFVFQVVREDRSLSSKEGVFAL
jgi:hypothetical protein